MADGNLTRATMGTPSSQVTTFEADVVTLPREAPPRKPAPVNFGWTLKGVPTDTVELTRKAARVRGMRIGSWVAESLRKAAMRDLGEVSPGSTQDSGILSKLDQMKEELKAEIKVVSSQNSTLDQEITLIRRDLLPRLVGLK